MDWLMIVIFMLFLLLLKGFFSGSEIALVNSNKIKLHHKAKQGNKGAKMVLDLFNRPEVILGTTLVGTNIATVTFTTIGTMMMFKLFGDNGDLYAFLFFTPLLLIFGEIVPKSVYQEKSDELAPIIIYPLRFFSFLFSPLVFVFSRIARVAARLAGSGKNDQNVYITREQIRRVVEMADRSAHVDDFDKARISRVIRFSETTVGSVMVPVTEFTALNRNRTTEKAIQLVRRRGYNRLPIYSRNVTNITGIVTLDTWDLMNKDLLNKPLAELIKPACYVSQYQSIEQLLPILRKRDDHMAIVVNEFGAAIGLITLEDIIEEVVGEIDVGYDFDEYLPKRRHRYEALDEDVYIIDSHMPVSEANELLGVTFSITKSHTLGGLVMASLKQIPSQGEFIEASGCKITVEKANARGIQKLRVEYIN